MRKLLLSTILLLIPSMALAECPVSVGSQVTFDNFESITKGLAGKVVEKGEFETTAQYEERISAARSKPSTSVILENTSKYKSIEYDADKSRFVIRATALGEQSPGWWLSTRYAKIPDGVDIENKNFAVEIGEKQLSQKTYEASNAYGASVTVNSTTSESYVIFSRPGGKTGKSHWEVDDRTKIGDSKYKSDVIYLDMPVEQAVSAKDNFKWGVVVTPRAPHYFETVYASEAKVTLPREKMTTYKTLVANIECAIITDDNKKVLKVVLPR